MSQHGHDRAGPPRAADARAAMRARLLAPGLDPDEARQIAERLGWRPIAMTLASPRCPQARRRLLETVIAERAARMPDGEAISLARLATEPVLKLVAERRAPRVLAAVLAAPRSTAAVARIVRERSDLPSTVRAELLAASRFAGSNRPDGPARVEDA